MSFYLPTQYSPYKLYADRLLHFQEFASTNKREHSTYLDVLSLLKIHLFQIDISAFYWFE